MLSSCDLPDIGSWAFSIALVAVGLTVCRLTKQSLYDHFNELPPPRFRALSRRTLAGGNLGPSLGQRLRPLKEEEREGFGVVEAAILTLLGLLIGFTFSMAVSRYDQRKNFEEDEANAIGTEYFRADLLPASDAARVRDLLQNYLDQRILFYNTRDVRQLERINSSTTQLQSELWSTVQIRAASSPTPVVALAVSGMNDVLNSQGYTQFAWENRIPAAAWGLVAAIAVCCNLLIGYRTPQRSWLLFLVLPFAVAVTFFLIADIDSPRRGLIRVHPQNLIGLSQSLRVR